MGSSSPSFGVKIKKELSCHHLEVLSKIHQPFAVNPLNPKKGCVFSKAQGLQCRRYSDAPPGFFWKGQAAQQQWHPMAPEIPPEKKPMKTNS